MLLLIQTARYCCSCANSDTCYCVCCTVCSAALDAISIFGFSSSVSSTNSWSFNSVPVFLKSLLKSSACFLCTDKQATGKMNTGLLRAVWSGTLVRYVCLQILLLRGPVTQAVLMECAGGVDSAAAHSCGTVPSPRRKDAACFADSYQLPCRSSSV